MDARLTLLKGLAYLLNILCNVSLFHYRSAFAADPRPSFCASEGLAIPAYPSLLAHSFISISRGRSASAADPRRSSYGSYCSNTFIGD